MIYPELQRTILADLLEARGKKSDIVEQLADLLKVSRDGIYRRMRGDTLLTTDELATIAKEFRISLDAYIFGKSDTFFFTYNAFSQRVHSFSDFLNSISRDLEQLVFLPQAKILYASCEIPPFYYCFFPELISFKLYVWGRTIWNLDFLNNKKFTFNLVSPDTLSIANSILKNYCKVPSVQIWSQNLFDNTLNQIEYQAASGGFSDIKDAILLCEKLEALVVQMKLMAELGKKNMHSDHLNFTLYHNEMIYTNNTVLVTSDLGNMTYTTFCNPNFLKTSNADLCNYTENWFQKLIMKSNNISLQGEKSRNLYFNNLAKKVESCKKRISLLTV